MCAWGKIKVWALKSPDASASAPLYQPRGLLQQGIGFIMSSDHFQFQENRHGGYPIGYSTPSVHLASVWAAPERMALRNSFLEKHERLLAPGGVQGSCGVPPQSSEIHTSDIHDMTTSSQHYIGPSTSKKTQCGYSLTSGFLTVHKSTGQGARNCRSKIIWIPLNTKFQGIVKVKRTILSDI